jgi:2-methylisocitrate lyase-like PEP mutase family enzyme
METSTRLRQMLQEPDIIVAPGAYDCLTARLIQQAGFPVVYMTGAGTSVARLGYPDLSLATMTEMTANAATNGTTRWAGRSAPRRFGSHSGRVCRIPSR